MPDALSGAIGTPGLWIPLAAALAAGLVRGFSGFGTAMVYLPAAALVLGPFESLTTLIIMDLTGPLIHVPRALRDGQPADVERLVLGAVVVVPLGVLILALAEPVAFRWAVSLVALVLLALLASGLRYRGRLTPPMIFATGAIGGFLAGCVGLPGPPVILLYMASALPSSAVRANLMLYLIAADAVMLFVLGQGGFLAASAVVLGLLVILPYTLGNWLGARLYRPGAEVVYRRVAYAIIAGSAVTGLPVWD